MSYPRGFAQKASFVLLVKFRGYFGVELKAIHEINRTKEVLEGNLRTL